MILTFAILLAAAFPYRGGLAFMRRVASTGIAPQVRAGSGRRPGMRSTNPLGRTPEVISDGRLLYNSSCTVCHGLEGTDGDRGPALAANRRYLRSSDDDLFAAIKNGIPGTLMPAAGLPDDRVWKIVAYIRSLRATASDEIVDGTPERGAELFQGRGGCVKCHMIRGRGGMLGPDLSNIAAERSVRYLRQALTEPRSTIPAGFQPVRLTMKSGETLDGVIKNENNFSLQVMDRSYALHLLQRDDVAKTEYGKRSLMPYDYGKNLTPAELQDLLAFLSRQVRQ
jgi:putative heme-binding domain-containing protein